MPLTHALGITHSRSVRFEWDASKNEANQRKHGISEEELLGKPLSEKQKRELLALMDMRDEDIDTSDIPEVKELPAGTVRARFHRGQASTSRDLPFYPKR